VSAHRSLYEIKDGLIAPTRIRPPKKRKLAVYSTDSGVTTTRNPRDNGTTGIRKLQDIEMTGRENHDKGAQ